MLLLIRRRLEKKYACLARKKVFVFFFKVSGFAGVDMKRGVGEKMWGLPTRWGGNPLYYSQKKKKKNKTGRLKESYSVMSIACSVVQFSHMCCGRSPISHMHELHIGAGINGQTCEG